MEESELLDLIRERARQRVLFLPHAVRQISRLDRMIRPAEVRKVLAEGEIIEDYPQDPRGHSALILGRGDDNRPIHVVCSPKDDYVAIITAYLPDPVEWSSDSRTRRNP